MLPRALGGALGDTRLFELQKATRPSTMGQCVFNVVSAISYDKKTQCFTLFLGKITKTVVRVPN